MKARYQFRFYPKDQQQKLLAQLFGCVRVVWNDALAICKQVEKLPSNNDLQKLVITQGKKTIERQWLSDVSNIPLQQSVADLGIAYKNFFNSCKGKRKGKKIGSPKFKKKTNQQSARFRIGGFSIKGGKVYLAKIGNVSPLGRLVFRDGESFGLYVKLNRKNSTGIFVLLVDGNRLAKFALNVATNGGNLI
jgi:putative transposase